jgi:hypothetical protein
MSSVGMTGRRRPNRGKAGAASVIDGFMTPAVEDRLYSSDVCPPILPLHRVGSIWCDSGDNSSRSMPQVL